MYTAEYRKDLNLTHCGHRRCLCQLLFVVCVVWPITHLVYINMYYYYCWCRLPRNQLAASAMNNTTNNSRCSSMGRFGMARSYLTWSSLPEEHTMIREMCRNFADNELAPNAGEWDKNHTFPRNQVRSVRLNTHLYSSSRLLFTTYARPPCYYCRLLYSLLACSEPSSSSSVV